MNENSSPDVKTQNEYTNSFTESPKPKSKKKRLLSFNAQESSIENFKRKGARLSSIAEQFVKLSTTGGLNLKSPLTQQAL